MDTTTALRYGEATGRDTAIGYRCLFRVIDDVGGRVRMSSPQILTHGQWERVEPEDAGWTYVSFEVRRLAAGESFSLPADGRERAFVPLSGTASAVAGDDHWDFGGRKSVFEGLGWCLYIPRDRAVTITATSDLELAVADAPATRAFEAVLVTPDDIAIELRGGGNASRQVGSLMLPDFPADRLHVIEVWTPGGNWSSYPPHKHEHDVDGEAELEETYYYRLRDPENGWAIQRVYSPEREFDLTQTVHDGDLLLIPWAFTPRLPRMGTTSTTSTSWPARLRNALCRP